MKNLFENYMNINYEKIIAWGTGKYYHDVKGMLNLEYDFLIDGDPAKWGHIIDGKKVKDPHVLLDEDNEDILVVIFSSFYKEICEELEKLGIRYFVSGYELAMLNEAFDNNSIDNLKNIENIQKNRKILTVSRNNYTLYVGGTSKFIREQMEISNRAGYTHIHFYWKNIDLKEFKGVYFFVIIDGKQFEIYSMNLFSKLLINLHAVIVHNLIDLETNVFQNLISKKFFNTPIYYYIHDFSCLCKNIKLTYNDDFFCEGYNNEWSLCSTCKFSKEKNKIFEFHKQLFTYNNVHLVAPSENTKNIINKSFEKLPNEIIVLPHQVFKLEKVTKRQISKKVKIAYVGYKHKFKGWDTFKKLVKDFSKVYDFYCFGFSDETLENVQHIDVSFIEDGETAMTNKLIEHKIDVALLWSELPETYSYTFYESAAAGTYILTSKLSGNIKDQVLRFKNGAILQNYEELQSLLANEAYLRKIINDNSTIFTNLKSNEEGVSKLLLL